MTVPTRPGYIVRRAQDSPTVPCPCGQSMRVITRADTTACNVHFTFIQDSRRHYHRACTEVYTILEGRGKMELNGDTVDVEPGTVVTIEPYARHRVYSEAGVRTVIVGFPALDPEDEFFD